MKTSSGGTSVLTASGIVAAVILMAIFTSINFLGIRKLAHTNSAATWWKVGDPAADDLRARRSSTSTRATSTPPTASTRSARKGVLAAVSTSGIIFALPRLRAGRPARRRERAARSATSRAR